MRPMMSEAALTRIFHFIRTYIYSQGFSPSQREIAQGCRLSVSTIPQALEILEARGKITRDKRKPRSIQVNPNATD